MSHRKNPLHEEPIPQVSQVPATEHDEIIVLTHLRSKPVSMEAQQHLPAPPMSLSTSFVSSPSTEPDLQGIEDNEEIVLLTRPSSTRLPIPSFLATSTAPPTTLDTDAPEMILPLQNPSYYQQPATAQTVEEYEGMSAGAIHSLETRTALIPPAPDTTPPAHTHLSASLDAIAAVLNLEPMPSPMSLLAPVFQKDLQRPDESSETELMIHALLGQRLPTSPSAENAAQERSSVSLSQITSFLEGDDQQHPPLSYTKADFRPSYEYIQPLSQHPYFTDNNRRNQLQAIEGILKQLTQHCARACCFLYKDGLFLGVAGFGKGKIQERVLELIFPADIPSLLSQVLHRQEPYWGILPDSAMDQIMIACLGGILPQRVGLFPIPQHSKTVAVFYLDDGGEESFPEQQVVEKILHATQSMDFRWFPPTLEELLQPILGNSSR